MRKHIYIFTVPPNKYREANKAYIGGSVIVDEANMMRLSLMPPGDLLDSRIRKKYSFKKEEEESLLYVVQDVVFNSSTIGVVLQRSAISEDIFVSAFSASTKGMSTAQASGGVLLGDVLLGLCMCILYMWLVVLL